MHILSSGVHACGADVTITDVTKKTPDRKWDWGREWHHARRWWAEDFGIWKKLVSWDSNQEEGRRFSELAEARPIVCGGGAARGRIRWKSQDRKKLCLSLLMSENLKLKKVIKSFVPESILSVFRFLYAYEPSMNTSTFHVLISGYVTLGVMVMKEYSTFLQL